jgi:cyclic dehypoxanthinyl futalosine synthase
MGPEVAQLSLRFGVNDFGSLMIEENVVRQAGASFALREEQVRRLISDQGYFPHRRNQKYELLDVFPEV